MSRPVEIRCKAPHPDSPGRRCNAWLTNAIDGSVAIERDGTLRPGCSDRVCPRCGARYVVCPVAA